jgi:hypothetical protein
MEDASATRIGAGLCSIVRTGTLAKSFQPAQSEKQHKHDDKKQSVSHSVLIGCCTVYLNRHSSMLHLD